MFLAFQISDIIRVPFGYLLDWLYQFTANYGVALILFSILVKLLMTPIQAKSKKSMIKMSRLAPRVQALQKKFADDPQRQNQEVQALYKREGVSMGTGCLWSFVPLLILLPLYQVIRQPIVYMLHETLASAEQIVEIVKADLPNLFTKSNTYYAQLIAAPHIPQFSAAIKEALPELREATLAGINFHFLGIDLGAIPTFNVFSESWKWDWLHIGGFLLPVISAASQLLTMWLGTKLNNSVITNEKGIQDQETAKNSQQAQSNKMMMWMMPIMSLWIGFTVPCALSLYWLIQTLASAVQDTILTKHYRKIYDAEDAVRLAAAMEEEAAEEERERQRAEKRAANPDGITENTSKKKMQKKQQQAEAAAKAAAAKEYAAKKGVVVEEDDTDAPLSGIPGRPFCKGRAYDPNRYGSTSTEE